MPADGVALDIEDLVLTRASGFSLRVPRLRLPEGTIGVVAGPSGSGKSTLLDAIAGVPRSGDRLTARGAIRIAGQPRPAPRTAALRALLRERVVVLPQDAISALDPLQQLREWLATRTGAPPAALAAALRELGVDDADALLARHPHAVSGGQAQMALLAVALCRRPALCLLDEPTAGLDSRRVDDLLAALARLRARHPRCAILIASHDPRLRDRLPVESFVIGDGALRNAVPEVGPFPSAGRAQPGGEILLRARGLCIAHGGRDVQRGLDVELRAGEIVVVLGPSGVGKTSLARVLAGHARAARGSIERMVPRTAVQMLFQDARGSLTPGVSMRRQCREVAASGVDLDADARELGLDPELLDRSVEGVSGGECRRAALLRALCVRPRVLLLDEPTANLDREAACAVVELLLRVRSRHAVAMLWITHDDDLARAVADRVLRLVPLVARELPTKP
ncbi:MAG: ATP-binding cassette domain-containing protein [Planctomycetota bacterium]